MEGNIRTLVRSNRSANVYDSVASNDAIATGAASIADIDRLMAELQAARDYLQAEGERVRQINAEVCPLGADCIGLSPRDIRQHRQMAYPGASVMAPAADGRGSKHVPRCRNFSRNFFRSATSSREDGAGAGANERHPIGGDALKSLFQMHRLVTGVGDWGYVKPIGFGATRLFRH